MVIYKITNKENNKSYIGKTIGNFSDRKANHCWLLRENKHSNLHFQNSWNKYGEDCFEFKVIEECESLDEASKETNILNTSISNCLNDRSKTAGGYKWGYK